MDRKKPESNTETIQRLATGLADKPELAQRLLAIVNLANEAAEAGKVRGADEVETLLVEEVRKLGNQTLASWARGVDKKLGEELKGQSGGQLHPAFARCDRGKSAKLFAAAAESRLRLRDGSVFRAGRQAGAGTLRIQLAGQRGGVGYAGTCAGHCRQTGGAHILPGKGAATVVAEADGSFPRIVSTDDAKTDRRKTRKVRYREARLCAASAKGSRSIYYDATFSDVRHIAGLWSFTAKDAGMAINSKVRIVADGADWIHREESIDFGTRGGFLIDLYHVLEYPHAAAPSCSATPQPWLKTRKKRLKSGHSKKVVAELKKHIEPDASPETDSPVRRAWRYLNNRRDCLAYDAALHLELPLGSGLIESGNKHVLQARLKIPGAAWNIQTAENFARSRALRANGGWDSYWVEASKAAA